MGLKVLLKNCQSSGVEIENVMARFTKQMKKEDPRKIKRGTFMPDYTKASNDDGELESIRRLCIKRVSARLRRKELNRKKRGKQGND